MNRFTKFIWLMYAMGIAIGAGTALLLLSTVFARFSLAKEVRTRIAVIDTGMSKSIDEYICQDAEHLDLTGQGMRDVDGHGSNIANILIKDLNPNTHCLVVIKWYHNERFHVNGMGQAIMHAIAENVRYINMSLVGETPDHLEEFAIKLALSKGIVVAVSAGNDGSDLGANCDAYPACYRIQNKNFYIVANFQGLTRYPSSNYGGPVNAFEDGVNVNAGGFRMTGTSQSTAVFLNKKIRSKIDF